MRFAIASTDRYLGVFDAFLKAGWEPVKLFVTPGDGTSDPNRAIIARATKLKLDVQASRMTQRDLRDLAERKCDALVVATYEWRICDWRPFLGHAVNFHCSPLPVGRGPNPTIRAILEKWESWGVTCHKIEPEFDTGAILAQELFPTALDECQESLDLKIQMAAGRLATRVAADFANLWDNGSPQGQGSYWKRPTEEQKTIDFAQPVESILRQVRAFEQVESIAKVSGAVVLVRRATGWAEVHDHPPGKVVHVAANAPRIVIAARDGYVALVDWRLLGGLPAPLPLV